MARDGIAPYVEGWKERAARRREREARRALELRDKLDAVVRILREHGATQVILFGSLARDALKEASDVDLLVDGIAAESLIDAALAVERVLGGVHVDLVPLATARPEVIARANEEGERLYG